MSRRSRALVHHFAEVRVNRCERVWDRRSQMMRVRSAVFPGNSGGQKVKREQNHVGRAVLNHAQAPGGVPLRGGDLDNLSTPLARRVARLFMAKVAQILNLLGVQLDT
jgi:hypothetical protein